MWFVNHKISSSKEAKSFQRGAVALQRATAPTPPGPPGYFESHENGECSFYAKTMYDIQKNGRQFANHLDPMLPQQSNSNETVLTSDL